MRLSIFLLAALLIGCKSNTGVEPDRVQYPIVTGTWMITGPDKADWIGKQSKGKVAMLKSDSTGSDTLVYLERPDGQSLRMEKYDMGSNNGQTIYGTKMTFVDSTLVIPDSIYYVDMDKYVPPSEAHTWGYMVDFPQNSYLKFIFGRTRETINIEDRPFSPYWAIDYPCSAGPSAETQGTVEIRLVAVFHNTDYSVGDSYIQTYKHYKINIDGMKEVVEHFHCN